MARFGLAGTLDAVEAVTIRNNALNALAPQHQLFVAHYVGLADDSNDPRARWNAASAARAAGYGEAGSRVRGHELLQRLDVKLAIAEALTNLREQHEAIAQRAIEELAGLAFARIDDVVDVARGRLQLRENISPAAWAAISDLREHVDPQGNVTLRVKLHSKPQALALLLKALGYTDAPTSIPGVVTDESGVLDEGKQSRIRQALGIRGTVGPDEG